MSFSNDKLPEFIYTAELGQDLFIPFGGLEIWENNVLTETIVLDKTKTVFIADEALINWTSIGGNIIDDPDGNLAIYCSRTDLTAIGKTTISGIIFYDEAVNHREPYCKLVIKIQ